MSLWKQIKRWRAAKPVFPPEWRSILEEHYPAYAQLGDQDRAVFEVRLQHFVEDKNWEGAGGLEVTSEMQVLIAASAARIARRLPLEVYDGLESIVIYPGTFEHEEGHGAYGLAHRWGTVVLSWDAVTHGIDIPHDGNDTAIHEFAHILDFEEGSANGTPLLEHGADYRSWGRVMGKHFARLQEGAGIRKVMDTYGATNEAEFFAVATESFFERPEALKRVAPDLFDELCGFYRIDPTHDEKDEDE